MKNRLTAVLWIALGITVMVAIAAVYNQLLAPRSALLAEEHEEVPDYDRIAEAITGTTVQKDIEACLAPGSRFTGSEGFYRTAEMAEERLRSLGYRMVYQDHEVVVPRTHFCRLLAEDGQPVPGVQVYPYYPNRLRTGTTPVAGITGKVVYKGDPDGQDKIEALDQASGNIMLLRVRERFQDYANFGARAILYFLDEEHDPKAWYYRRKESHASIDVPVFLVQGEFRGLIGRTVTIQARTDWEYVPVRNLFAVLDPEPGFDEALDETLLINAYLDSWSPIPALAPGARQMLSLQTALQAAEVLAGSANRSRFRRRVVFFLSAGRGQAAAGSRHLVSALGSEAEAEKTRHAQREEHEALTQELSGLRQVAELLPRYFRECVDRRAHERFWAGRKESLALFRRELTMVLDEGTRRAEEDALSARLDWIRDGKRKGDLLDLYLAVNKRAQVYQSMTSAKPYMLVRPYLDAGAAGYRTYYDPESYWEPGRPTRTAHGSVRHAKMYEETYAAYLEDRIGALAERVRRRIERTAFRVTQNEQDQAVFELIRGPDGKRRVLSLELNFTDKTKQLVLASGGYWWSSRVVPADRDVELQFTYAQEKLFPDTSDADRFHSRVTEGDAWSCGANWSLSYFHAGKMTFSGYTSFVLITKGDDREFFASPMDTMDEINWDNVVAQQRVIVAGLEQLALGGGKIVPTSMPVYSRDFRGITTSVRGNSLVPDHPEQRALVQLTGGFWVPASWAHFSNGGGYWTAFMDPYPVEFSDELGRFRFRGAFGHRWWITDFHAARSDPETGEITWVRDLGYESKYPTHDKRVYQVGDLTRIVMFRCTPIHIFKAENPKSMQL
ncbi:MAG: hypothetical protein JXR77_13575, partial [Lentisphaeria bacterium]|nr:hypothetical protein [Lentisphaeria bacterium]